MKAGDLVIYQTLTDIIHTVGSYPKQHQIWVERGILVEIKNVGITQKCVILDDKTGKLIEKYRPQVILAERKKWLSETGTKGRIAVK